MYWSPTKGVDAPAFTVAHAPFLWHHTLLKQIMQAISDTFGKSIWKKTVLVLTHGNLVQPPPGSDFGEKVCSSQKFVPSGVSCLGEHL